SGYYAGGLAGCNAGVISGCSSVGFVQARTDAGGLVGFNAGTVIQCHGDGRVVGEDGVGGLVGFSSQRIVASSSAATVSGTWRSGGLAGSNGGTIVASCATGVVSGNAKVGGLAGANDGDVVASYSIGAATGVDRIGGLVGEVYGHIVASYSTGAVTGSTYVGGLVGSTRGGRHAYASFWDVETSGQTTSLVGIGKTTAELQSPATFLDVGWDFVDETLHGTCDFWRMSPGEYPRLRYCVGEGPVMPEGLGTPAEPYLIRNARDLGTVWFQPAAHYRLAASIDLSGILWSTSVVPSFDGTFDGNGCVVNNLSIRGQTNLALFGILDYRGRISNLGLDTADVNGISYVAGLAVENRGTIVSSYSRGTIHGLACAGGLTAWNRGTIATSYSRGMVPETDHEVGGLAGRNDGDITASYCADAWTGGGYVVGLVGYYGRSGKVTASFWDAEASGLHPSGWDTGKTTAEMQMAKTFLDAGWDFVDETANGTDDIWWIDEGKDYPRLWWERREPVRLPVIELDGTNFDAQIAHGVVLVDFFATWCSPCSKQAPILEDVADRLEGRAQVAKLDVDKSRGIVLRYGVTAVPTLILFREGVEVTRFVGVTSADVLVAAILAAGSSE
ncbi:MAG: thioredoxin domain-containing protein, partial [Phycisphaerales bacterium]